MVLWLQLYNLDLPPTQDASHHQDYEPFSVGDPDLNLHFPLLLGGSLLEVKVKKHHNHTRCRKCKKPAGATIRWPTNKQPPWSPWSVIEKGFMKICGGFSGVSFYVFFLIKFLHVFWLSLVVFWVRHVGCGSLFELNSEYQIDEASCGFGMKFCHYSSLCFNAAS